MYSLAFNWLKCVVTLRDAFFSVSLNEAHFLFFGGENLWGLDLEKE